MVIRLIKNSDDGLTIYELSKKTGLSAGSCLSAIQRASEKPLIIKEDDGIRIKKRYTFGVESK